MIKEYQKYRAEIFKISGFALMTPFARVILCLLESGFELTTQLAANLVGSLVLLILGVIMIQRGYEGVMNDE